jgi:cobalt-zinc-cadmium efflux system protein
MPPHSHSHAHGTHSHVGHSHGHAGGGLGWAAVLTIVFAAVEATTGLWSNSLALLSDAGHMLTDSLSLWLATAAAWFSRRPPSPRHTYGYGRLEVLAALFNAGFMGALVLAIGWSAIQRLKAPLAVDGNTVTWVALAGLAINLAVAWVLMRGEQDLNTRGALLHVMGDLLGSVAALVAGLVITWTGWMPIDPLLSLLICALIGVSTWRLALDALHVLAEGVPAGLSLQAVGKRMAAVAGVATVHDLHIWAISSTHLAASAHVVVQDLAHWPQILADLRHAVHHDFGIDHVTLQPELQGSGLVQLVEPEAGNGQHVEGHHKGGGHEHDDHRGHNH